MHYSKRLVGHSREMRRNTFAGEQRERKCCMPFAQRFFTKVFCLAVSLIAVTIPRLSEAVCFYPGTLKSGYIVPLAKEVQSTPIILIGTVVKTRALADPNDSQSYAYQVYTVRVSEILKGSSPGLVVLFTSNDSGGFKMNVGETDLLFLRKRGNFYEVDGCGNSGDLGKFGANAERIRSLLTEVRHPR